MFPDRAPGGELLVPHVWSSASSWSAHSGHISVLAQACIGHVPAAVPFRTILLVYQVFHLCSVTSALTNGASSGTSLAWKVFNN